MHLRIFSLSSFILFIGPEDLSKALSEVCEDVPVWHTPV